MQLCSVLVYVEGCLVHELWDSSHLARLCCKRKWTLKAGCMSVWFSLHWQQLPWRYLIEMKATCESSSAKSVSKAVPSRRSTWQRKVSSTQMRKLCFHWTLPSVIPRRESEKTFFIWKVFSEIHVFPLRFFFYRAIWVSRVNKNPANEWSCPAVCGGPWSAQKVKEVPTRSLTVCRTSELQVRSGLSMRQ